MASLSDWEKVQNLPNTLEKILKETEINNSFTESVVTDTLQKTTQSSYAYLYKLQKDATLFRKFHFQTRDYLLRTTRNDIENGLKLYGGQLAEERKKENPDNDKISELEKLIDEFGEVHFGDLYLDDKRQVCMNINFDMIDTECRGMYRSSKFYMKDLMMPDIMDNPNIFRYLAFAIVDRQTTLNIKLYPYEKGTKVIFSELTSLDLYNNTDSQIFHDICVIFIKNEGLGFHIVDKEEAITGKVSFSPKTDKDGLYFVFLNGRKNQHSHLLPARYEDGFIHYELDEKSRDVIKNAKDFVEVSIIFFQGLFVHNYTGTEDGCILVDKKERETPDGYIDVIEGNFFVPTLNGSILPMPIPEDNIMIMKFINDHFEPCYQCEVNLHYPNIYQITDPNMVEGDKYKVYFSYRDLPDIRYTPLFDFYWNYLENRYSDKYSVEEIINLIYFKKKGYETNTFIPESTTNGDSYSKRILEGDMLDAFYSLFEKMMQYLDFKYIYGTPDFMTNYIGENIPRQYKIARMFEFERANWEVLPKYVKSQRRKETLFHFFTNTINLSGRFRRSTRLEDKEGKIGFFANSATISEATNPNAFLVTDNEDYDRQYEVYIEDVKVIIPSVNVGDYVAFDKLTDRYVFAFKNPGKNFLGLKVFVDGLLCSDLVHINSIGVDYLYIPAYMVNENSYIMMELEWSAENVDMQVLEYSNNTEWKAIHLIEQENVEYTMNDIVITSGERVLNPTEYTLNLVRNKISYSMFDERHNVENKYGSVIDVDIQLTNFVGDFPAIVTVKINKTSYVAYGLAERNGYPRFDTTQLKANFDMKHSRLYHKGRLCPSYAYRVIDSQGRNYVQSRIFCYRGDSYYFEYSPFAKELICSLEKFSPNDIFDFSKYGDKPLDPEYYEVYVNGRRLGLPNLFPFGPHHAVFRGLKSDCLIEIFEKERDYEYFGYSKIFVNGETFFFVPNDLINQVFMTEEEAKVIIDNYIKQRKHKNAIILPNEIVEERNMFSIQSGLLEEMKIFFFEELLQTGITNPDLLQFNKVYFSEVFPEFTKEFMVEREGEEPVIFLDPDVTVRFYDEESNEYEKIDTYDADESRTYVMITGMALDQT